MIKISIFIFNFFSLDYYVAKGREEIPRKTGKFIHGSRLKQKTPQNEQIEKKGGVHEHKGEKRDPLHLLHTEIMRWNGWKFIQRSSMVGR